VRISVSRISLVRAASLPAACDLAPPYRPPTVAAPPVCKQTGQAPHDWTVASPKGDVPRGAWWHVFHHPVLNALENKAATANQDLKVGVARFDQARADAKAAQADYYPTVDASGSVTRNHLSHQIATPLPTITYNDFGLGPDLRYEIDAWGRVRNRARTGRERAEASAGDLATIDLSLHAELAVDYFILRGYDSEQDILDRAVQDYQKVLDLTRARFKIGYAAESDVSAAETHGTDCLSKEAAFKSRVASLANDVSGLPAAASRRSRDFGNQGQGSLHGLPK
jgi:outer membrane protein TolC